MKSISLFFQNLTAFKKLILLFAPLLSILLSIKAALVGLLILIFIDLLTGIKKTLHTKGIPFHPWKGSFWRGIKSFLLRQTLKKTYEYGLLVIVFIVFESLIFGTMPIMLVTKSFTLTELSVIIAALVEIYSIAENIEAVTGTNLIKKVIGLLPEKIQNLIKK